MRGNDGRDDPWDDPWEEDKWASSAWSDDARSNPDRPKWNATPGFDPNKSDQSLTSSETALAVLCLVMGATHGLLMVSAMNLPGFSDNAWSWQGSATQLSYGVGLVIAAVAIWAGQRWGPVLCLAIALLYSYSAISRPNVSVDGQSRPVETIAILIQPVMIALLSVSVIVVQADSADRSE